MNDYRILQPGECDETGDPVVRVTWRVEGAEAIRKLMPLLPHHPDYPLPQIVFIGPGLSDLSSADEVFDFVMNQVGRIQLALFERIAGCTEIRYIVGAVDEDLTFTGGTQWKKSPPKRALN